MPWSGDWVYLWRCYMTGELSPSQSSLFFQQMVDLTFDVRPRVTERDPVPYRVQYIQHELDDLFRAQLSVSEISIDHQPLKDYEAWSTWGPQMQCMGSVFFKENYSRWSFLSSQTVGSHQLHVVIDLRVNDNRGKQAYHTTTPFDADFQVIEDRSRLDLKRQIDPSLHSRLANSIGLYHFELREKMIEGLVGLAVYMPASVAFDAFARVGDKEYPIGFLSRVKGGPNYDCYGLNGKYEGPPISSFDLILLSSDQAARNTVDIFEFWDGELVFKDVPVKVLSTATATAPSQ